MVDKREPRPRSGDEEQLRNAPASRDREHTERFTDEEAALLRHLRFGQLPDSIPPSDWVEGVDGDAPFEPPEPRLGSPYWA